MTDKPPRAYYLRPQDAQKARANAKRKASGHRRSGGYHNYYVSATRSYDTKPQSCECEKPWHAGDGICSYCGKAIPRLSVR